MESSPTFRSCDRAREVASRALDGEASPFEERLLEVHLERCPSCRAFDADARAATAALRAAPLERLEYPIELPRRRALRPLHGTAAAAVAAAAALLLTITSPLDLGGTPTKLAAPRTQEPRIVEDAVPFPADLPQRAERRTETIQQ